MKMMCIVALSLSLALGCFTQLVVGEQVCSNFCSSLGMLESNPGKSCADIYQINKATRGVSSDYWVNTTTGVHQVYCDMELECGGHKGGWMRIADLDTSRGDACPGSEWILITTTSVAPFIPVCQPRDDDAGCYSTSYSVIGAKYFKICGKVRGYQIGGTDGLNVLLDERNIDGPYVDGVSITLGQPRKHVWTYASGFTENENFPDYNCPCASTPGRNNAVSIVQDNYYCESGSISLPWPVNMEHTNDPLWDGDQCNGDNNCCTSVGMPWFYRQFSNPQDEDIEVRICHDESRANEGILVDQLQLYVQ